MSYFLRIDGIAGESSTLPYLHWIEVESFDLGHAGMQGSGTGGNAHSKTIMFAAKLDSSFPKLRLAAVLGKPIHSATIAGTSNSSLLQITCTDCIVSSVQAAFRGQPHVRFSLSCNTVNMQQGHVKAVINKPFSSANSFSARRIP